MKQVIAAQGEVMIIRVDTFDDGKTKPFNERNEKGWIISHSESGHHHLLADGEVMECVKTPPGVRILQAIVAEPTRMFQDAASPHDPIDLEPGLYEFRIAREYDPFAEQARQVAD